MITYKLFTGDKEQSVLFPTGYHDLTYKQFLRLRTEYTGDIGQLLDILTDIPRAIWMKLPVAEANKITKFLSWIVDSPIKWDEIAVPATLHFHGKDFTIPKDLGLETFGQKIVLETKISQIVNAMLHPAAKSSTPPNAKTVALSAQQKAATQLVSFIPYVVATYMQPRLNNTDFNEDEVLAVEQEILNCRAVEVYPIGNFFIRTLLGSAKSGTTRSQVTKRKLKAANYRKEPALKKSKKKRGTS